MPLDDLAIAEPSEMDGDAAPSDQLAAPAHHIGPNPEQADRLARWSDPNQTINICDEILDSFDDGEGLLGRIGQTVVRQYDIDVQSRSEWMAKTKTAIDFASLIAQGRDGPWPGSSNLVYPLIASAAIQFRARAYPAIVPGPDIVKGVILGKDDGIPAIDPETGAPIIDPATGEPAWLLPPGAKRERADRIGQHMSWQLLEEMEEWEEETDRLLVVLPIVGCAFRKSYFDNVFDRNMAVLVHAQNMVINYRAKSLETAPRLTEETKLYPVEIEEAQRSGVFLPHEFGIAEDGSSDEDAPHDFLEQHRRLDLDGDGYTEPYVVTVHKQTAKVCRIVARYEPDGIKFSGITHKVAKIQPVHYYTKYDFLPNPDGGIYGVGFGQLLNPINDSINSALNMLFDAGSLQNSGGGFIAKGLSMQAGSIRRKLGEWTYVNAPGRTVRESLVPLEHQGPSETMFKLLGFLVEVGDKLASNTEVLSGTQSGANVPASTTLALIEQGLKVFSAIYKSIHRSLKREFDKQKRLNTVYLDREAQYRRGEEWRTISQEDYIEGAGVQPVSDPAMVSDMQQLVRGEFLKEYVGNPLCNGPAILKRIFEAAKIDDIEELINPNPPPNPAMVMKAEELKIKNMVGKAQALHYMASSIERLAEADKKVAETFGAWVQAQMTMLQQQYEALDGDDGDEAGGGAAAAGGQGNPSGGLPALA